MIRFIKNLFSSPDAPVNINKKYLLYREGCRICKERSYPIKTVRTIEEATEEAKRSVEHFGRCHISNFILIVDLSNCREVGRWTTGDCEYGE